MIGKNKKPTLVKLLVTYQLRMSFPDHYILVPETETQPPQLSCYAKDYATEVLRQKISGFTIGVDNIQVETIQEAAAKRIGGTEE